MFEIFSTIFNTVIYQPIFNFLIFIYGVVGNFGLSIIILTLIIKIILGPLNKKSIESQKMMAEMQPKIKEIQKKYKDKEQQGRELLKLYQETKFNPFSGFFLLFLQIPILFALFRIFQSEINFEKISALIYPFMSAPQSIDYIFLGINLSQPNIFLAFLTAIVQFLQIKTSALPAKKDQKPEDQMEEVSQMVQKQTMIFIPVFTFIILFNLPSALGLYWSITTVLNIIQQRKIYGR
jgi:YidC/Oxa1 family membrane protein insertase